MGTKLASISPIPNPTSSPVGLIACIRAAHQLRDACAATGRVNHDEPQKLAKVWDALHAAQTHAWAKFSSTRTNAKIKALHSGPPREKKPVFNHEYTPLLEEYFEHNAYPSATERAALAKKSMMTPRQIEVWFQNHRNRAKREGKPLYKSKEDQNSFSTHTESQRLDDLWLGKKQKPLTENQKIKNDFSDEDLLPTSPNLEKLAESNPLNSPRPPHAFPTTYHHCCAYDAFPIKKIQPKFPVPEWYRKPAASSNIPPAPINFDDFIADFSSRLHLGPVCKMQRSETVKSWCADRIVIPPPAPLPALIRLGPSHVSSPTSIDPSRLPSLFGHATSPLALIPQTTTTSLSRHSEDTPRRRKVARLPKRTPKRPSTSHHRIKEPAEISQLSPPTTRAPSYTSDATSDRTPSYSSSSDSSSSGPTTPVLPYSTLSESPSLPSASIQGSDFDSADNVLSNGFHLPVQDPLITPFSVATLKQSATDPFETLSARRRQSRSLPRRSFVSSS